MHAIPPIRKLMTPFPYAVDVEDDTLAAEALMTEHDFRHLPVTRDGELVGIITSRDIASYVRALGGSTRNQAVSVRHVYRADAYIVDMDTPLDDVLEAMAQRRIGSALVTRKGRLAGVFTTSDLCRFVTDDLRERFRPGDGNDAA